MFTGTRAREVGRERVRDEAEALHRRGVRRLGVGRDDGGPEPGDRRGDRRGPARQRRGRRPRRRRGQEGMGRLAGEDPEGPDGAPARSRGRARRERRGARSARVRQRRQAMVGREGRAAGDVRLPPLLRGRGAEPRGQVGRRVRRGLHVDDPARAARDRRRNLPLELPAVHGDLEDRAGARRGQRPDHQAGRADAAHPAPLHGARAGRHPRRRPPGRDRGRDPRGRRARAASRDQARLPDRGHGDREDHREKCGRHRQAAASRARREGAHGRARRRRPGHGRGGDQDRRLLQLGSGLHGLLADPRLGRDLRRRAVGDGQGRRRHVRGRPGDRRRDRDGTGHLGKSSRSAFSASSSARRTRRRPSSRAAARSATAGSS